MFQQFKPQYAEVFVGKLFKVDTNRDISLTDFATFQYKRVEEDLAEITGMSRVEMPKFSTYIYTSAAITFDVGDLCQLIHFGKKLKVKFVKPDIRMSNSFAQSTVLDERGYIGKVVFFE